MKILSQIHAYPTTHNAGAEYYLHSLLRYLVSCGHECSVITQDIACRELDGVKLFEQNPANEWELSKWCDIVITHLGRTGRAMNSAKNFNKPVYVIIHNTFTDRIVEVRQDCSLIFNSEWAKIELQGRGYNHRGIVLRPAVFFDDYHFIPDKKREYISLINLWDRKGGQIFQKIAKQVPDRKFLGVKGAYGEQVIGSLPNITYQENTPNIKELCYEKTRILLMPSIYESYGRTAVEAMCSGIPVICSDTPGLRESLGDCGIFVPQDAPISEWIKQIELLDTETTYNDLSLQCIERAKQLNDESLDELEQVEKFIQYEQTYSKPELRQD